MKIDPKKSTTLADLVQLKLAVAKISTQTDLLSSAAVWINALAKHVDAQATLVEINGGLSVEQAKRLDAACVELPKALNEAQAVGEHVVRAIRAICASKN